MNTPWCIHIVKTTDLKFFKSLSLKVVNKTVIFPSPTKATKDKLLSSKVGSTQSRVCLHHRKGASLFPATSAPPCQVY